MNNVTMTSIQIMMTLTGAIIAAFIYRKVPGMMDAWLATKERIVKMHADERDRERQWQTSRDKDD